jgi:hypothetical protein
LEEDTNGWNEYQRLVLYDLKRLNTEVVILRRELGRIHKEIIVVKVKMGFIGAIGGLVAGSLASFVLWLITK